MLHKMFHKILRKLLRSTFGTTLLRILKLILIRESFANKIPIHHSENSRSIVGAFVLIFQVIRMLPNVYAEDWYT